jgi:hypothetical protein
MRFPIFLIGLLLLFLTILLLRWVGTLSVLRPPDRVDRSQGIERILFSNFRHRLDRISVFTKE